MKYHLLIGPTAEQRPTKRFQKSTSDGNIALRRPDVNSSIRSTTDAHANPRNRRRSSVRDQKAPPGSSLQSSPSKRYVYGTRHSPMRGVCSWYGLLTHLDLPVTIPLIPILRSGPMRPPRGVIHIQNSHLSTIHLGSASALLLQAASKTKQMSLAHLISCHL